MSESDVVNTCLKWLLWNGYHAWRHNTGGYKPEGSKRFIRYGAKGSPDIVAVQPITGRFVGVECKSRGKTTSPDQKAFGDEITKRGGIYIVAYSVDDLEREL
jgi:hypothetical protein